MGGWGGGKASLFKGSNLFWLEVKATELEGRTRIHKKTLGFPIFLLTFE